MRAWPLLVLGLMACRSAPEEWPPGEFMQPKPEPEHESEPEVLAPKPNTVGTDIIVAGQRFDIGAPVVLWTEGPKYNAYSPRPRFKEEGEIGLRYRPGRVPRNEAIAAAVRRSGWNLTNLRQQIDQFVLHYDVAGVSQSCFKVLQDMRQLSVHFMLDVDGTIYQTLDLKEQAWHARQANPRSIGIEIAHIGAYPEGQPGPLDDWYPADASGNRLQLPARVGDGGVRTPNFQGRPARQGLHLARIQGGRLQQFDYTSEQYESLVKLSAGLSRVFPKIKPQVPRDDGGSVRANVLSDAEFQAFSGILGHYHISASKIDPGPAMDWEGLLDGMRSLLENGP